MKTLLISILIGLSIFNSFGQEENEVKYQFATEVFNSDEYLKGNYDRFYEQIKLIDSNTYQFGDKTLIVMDINPDLRKLFEKGVFNPNVIFGKETIKKSQSEIKTLNQSQKILFNHNRNDSITISSFEQLEKLNPNPKTKRFKFWVWRIGFANPTEYYIEFYNEKATKETEWNEFVENSKMSFYYKGTIII